MCGTRQKKKKKKRDTPTNLQKREKNNTFVLVSQRRYFLLSNLFYFIVANVLLLFYEQRGARTEIRTKIKSNKSYCTLEACDLRTSGTVLWKNINASQKFLYVPRRSHPIKLRACFLDYLLYCSRHAS